ncbi:MAG: bifunctional molybdenum cofactor biosynthesis protein MoaC/MoaB [Armatimonadetes bacterium]|nr:bifunctional molybdenum cofactor biosynthesis protein MoaC/MoaB [Armatimonadota bacterium]
MKDVTNKYETLREAVAEARMSLDSEAIDLLKRRATDKGDALECARVAGVMAAKNSPSIIPFCHPLPITYANVEYEFESPGLAIRARVKTIAVTGVEMEALTAASVAALTLYDMLKPHTENIEIQSIRLLEKSGGKSDFKAVLDPPIKAAVFVLSDTIAAGKKEDRAGKAAMEFLQSPNVGEQHYEILPDEPDLLRERIGWAKEHGFDLILAVGGTGLSARDKTVEALREMIDREIPGISEASRAYGQRRTPYAMLSRGIAGMSGGSLIVALPGSTKGARQSCEALFPAIFHVFHVMRGGRHKGGYGS